MKFDFLQTLKNAEWKPLIIVFFIIAVFSLPFSFLPFKNLNFKNKYLFVTLIANTLFLIFVLGFSINSYLKNKSELAKMENEYLKQARIDIKKDKINFKYSGGLELPMYNENTRNKIDSIRKNYGISYFNTGCIIDFKEIEAQKKYEEFVKPYLVKRNGKNWEAKMNSEIEKIKRDFR